MDILQTTSIFTEEDKKFNRIMVQGTRHDADRSSPASNAEKSLSPADKYFSCVNDILSDYCRKWGIPEIVKY